MTRLFLGGPSRLASRVAGLAFIINVVTLPIEAAVAKWVSGDSVIKGFKSQEEPEAPLQSAVCLTLFSALC